MPTPLRLFAHCFAATLAVALLFVTACSDPGKARQADFVVRDVPAVLRGTIGAEATIRGVEPVLVSGYGVVVGLNGTGGGVLPVQIQATMERELGRGGVGKGGPMNDGPIAGKTPREVLRDPNVAVVIVEGVVPPGAPKGATFDVRVRSLPGSSVTSLEGGTLWTTELRLGPVTPFGAMRTRKIAEARGAVFINPFADPSGPTYAMAAIEPAPGDAPPLPLPKGDNRAGNDAPIEADAGMAAQPPAAMIPSLADGITRTVGRVLAGGVITDPLQLDMSLDNPSHSRAISIQQAINSKFPVGPGDDGMVARGRNNSSIAVRVPHTYRDKSEEFLMLLKFTQIDQSFPQEYAKRYADALKSQPALADDLSWSLQALGPPATAFLTPLYDYPEFLPRMAALRAGAKLGDPRSAPYLIEMAKSGPSSLRADAIELLGQLGTDPRVSSALRELLDASELDVRVAAYEALNARGDPFIDRINVEGKFTLELVPAKEELIYITQQGKPRIVLFGTKMSLVNPMLATAWSDRLMVRSESDTIGDSRGPVRLYYRDYRTERVTNTRISKSVKELVIFLAHKPTPERPDPGLNLSYSEVVGALYEIQKQGGVDGGFATERDRLLARLMEAQDVAVVDDRPESDNDHPDELNEKVKPVPKPVAKPVAAPKPKQSLVVPLSPPGGVKAAPADANAPHARPPSAHPPGTPPPATTTPPPPPPDDTTKAVERPE